MPRRLLKLVISTLFALSLAATPALAATTSDVGSTSGSQLPFTGFDFGLIAAGGALLLLLGVGMSRLTRTANGRARQPQRRPARRPAARRVTASDPAIVAARATNGAAALNGDAEPLGATVHLLDELVEVRPGPGRAAARGA